MQQSGAEESFALIILSALSPQGFKHFLEGQLSFSNYGLL
jgi:hypothetical protein